MRYFACLYVLSFFLTTPAFAQATEGEEFGAPITAESPRDARQLPLAEATPPSDLAEGAELLVITGYEADDEAESVEVEVFIDQPGEAVVLVLTTYEKVRGQLTYIDAP